jgi:uncharacterized membrane protein
MSSFAGIPIIAARPDGRPAQLGGGAIGRRRPAALDRRMQGHRAGRREAAAAAIRHSADAAYSRAGSERPGRGDRRSGEMESRLKLLGHPVHPMLIVFPLGLLSTAVVFDVLYVFIDNPDLAIFSYWALVAGVIGGLVAAVFGAIDWAGIPRGTRAKRIGAIHGIGNVLVVALFALSLASRWSSPAYLPDTLPAILGILGAGVSLIAAWLGGELVYRLRVGVDDDAHVDATSSLARDGAVEVDG